MVIHVQSVGKKFPDGKGERWVIEDVSFKIESHQATVIRGPSGVGKTTLLSLIAGLIQPDKGEIELNLKDSSGPTSLNRLNARELLRFRRDHVGFVYQFFNLVPTLTVKENVLLPLALTKREHLRDQALDRLHKLGLKSHVNAFPTQLSGGEQQRAAIARAVAHEPQFLFADEPTGNLDAENSAEVFRLLWDEHERLGTNLVVATHSDDIGAYAARTIQLA